MTNDVSGTTMLAEKYTLRRPKFGAFLSSDPTIIFSNIPEDNETIINTTTTSSSVPSSRFYDNTSSPYNSGTNSPYNNNYNSFMSSPSPWNQSQSSSSPYTKSPWTTQYPFDIISSNINYPENSLIGSIVREEGHIYSLAASGDSLYTGSDSKNIRVWKNLQEFSGFKSNSGLVKAIVVLEGKVFTGHQDGKIRVWGRSSNKKRSYKRIGSMPTTLDYFKSSINPKSYVEVRRRRNVPWIRHFDAVSCLNLDVQHGLLYSGSWDKTFKVWRLSDFKCLESVAAHDDAVNSVVVGVSGTVYTGSADGTVKAWQRESQGKNATRHVLLETLLEQENAVTAVVSYVTADATVVYAGSSDGLVNFWEQEKQSMSYGGVLRGHKLAVLCLASAGRLVMSGSADKTICVWRREEGIGGVHTCLSVLTSHTGPVKCLAVEKDGNASDDDSENDCNDEQDQRWIVYSGSLDKSVKVWRVSEHTAELKQT